MTRLCAAMAAAFAASLALLATPATAQSWPQRPVKFVIPLGPGAGADIGARLFADRLTGRWGQPVVIENRPGGDGVVAINAVLGAKDDHVLMWGPSSSYVGHPYSLDKVPYDIADLQPVARVSSTVVALAVPASLPIHSLKEFMAYAKERSGKMNWASVTTITDIQFEGFFRNAGVDMTRISYRDTVSALNDLLEARIQFYGAAYAIVRGQAQAGKVRILAVSNRARAPGLDIPTAAEAGFPGLTFDGLVGLHAARGSNLGDAARRRIADDIRAVAAEPTVVERMTATAQVITPGDAAEFARSIDEQARGLATIAQALGIKPKQ